MNRDATERGSTQPAASRPAPTSTQQPGPRRADRAGGISAEERKRLMAQPLVRRAIELSSGSIVDVVRRIPSSPPQDGGEVVEDDDAVASTADDLDDDDTAQVN